MSESGSDYNPKNVQNKTSFVDTKVSRRAVLKGLGAVAVGATLASQGVPVFGQESGQPAQTETPLAPEASSDNLPRITTETERLDDALSIASAQSVEAAAQTNWSVRPIETDPGFGIEGTYYQVESEQGTYTVVVRTEDVLAESARLQAENNEGFHLMMPVATDETVQVTDAQGNIVSKNKAKAVSKAVQVIIKDQSTPQVLTGLDGKQRTIARAGNWSNFIIPTEVTGQADQDLLLLPENFRDRANPTTSRIIEPAHAHITGGTAVVGELRGINLDMNAVLSNIAGSMANQEVCLQVAGYDPSQYPEGTDVIQQEVVWRTSPYPGAYYDQDKKVMVAGRQQFGLTITSNMYGNPNKIPIDVMTRVHEYTHGLSNIKVWQDPEKLYLNSGPTVLTEADAMFAIYSLQTVLNQPMNL